MEKESGERRKVNRGGGVGRWRRRSWEADRKATRSDRHTGGEGHKWSIIQVEPEAIR